jgi:hypothetical protein
MNVKRTATFVTLGAATAVWLAAAATSGSRTDGQAIPVEVAPVDSRAATLAAEVARLRDHPTAVPPLQQPRRNLFSFGRTVPHRSSSETGKPVDAVPHPPAPPALPPLRLAGIGEDVTPGGVVRTAIISGPEDVMLAKEGDQVTPRYRVLSISADVVELTDLGDGSVRRLVFK